MSGAQASLVRLQALSVCGLFGGNGAKHCLRCDGMGGHVAWPCKLLQSTFGGCSWRLRGNAGPKSGGRQRAGATVRASCAFGRAGVSGRSSATAGVGLSEESIGSDSSKPPVSGADSNRPASNLHQRSEGNLSFPAAPQEWFTRVVQKAGLLVAAACLALAWMLAKPHSALATTRPPPSSATYASKSASKPETVVPNLSLVHTPNSPSFESLGNQTDDWDRTSTSESASVAHSWGHVQSAAFSKPDQLVDSDTTGQDWVQFSVTDSQASTSFHKAHSLHRTAENPLDLSTPVQRDGGSSASVSDAPPSQSPEGPSSSGDSSSKDSRGVQQREKLDVYYLPEQIPKPEAGKWVSDQGDFIIPEWITPRMNQIVSGLKKDTGTEIYVVAINALGKHAGVPEMVAAEICNQWQIGGPKGNGLLFLYVNKGGSSWERTEDGDVDMDVTYKRQLAVKVLPGLEQKLDKWGRKNGRKSAEEAVAELRTTVMVKMGIENATVGEVILEGLVGVAEKLWAAEGLPIPAGIRKDPTKVRKLTDLETVGVALALYAGWAWFDRGTLLSTGLSDTYGWLSGAFDRFSRRPGPLCRSCGEPTTLSGQAKPEEITDPGARKETELGSTNYFRYVCENLDCKGKQDEKTSLVGWGVPFRAKTCPGCGYRTVKQTSKSERRPGILSDGKIKRAVECLNCGRKGEGHVRDPSFVKALSLPWERQAAELAIDRESNGQDGSAGDVQPAGP